jgi:D-arginine dehydrogenase
MRVIVVGGGVVGCSVAWHLAPHADVVVLEAGARPGGEATAQNAGMVRRLGEDPAERALAIRTAEWLADPPPAFRGASRVTGAVLGLAHDQWHLHDAASHLRARGVDVHACDRPCDLAPALAGSAVPFAWWLPAERVADPTALVRGFLSAPIEVRVNTPALSLVRRQGRVVGVQTAHEVLEADAVVLAAGAWSGVLGQRPLMPVRRSIAQTSRHDLATDQHPWVWLDDVGVYARPRDGAWLVSSCDEVPEAPPVGPGSTGPASADAMAMAHDRLARWLPALGALAVARSWSGLRTFASDRRPMLGEDDDAPGLWWAAGLGGYGITCSVGVGEVVSQDLLGAPVDYLSHDWVRPSRSLPTRWPVRYTGALDEARLAPAV